MSNDASQMLATFWPRITNEIRNKPLLMPKTGSKKDEPVQELPLARIKKIMKQDGDVKMISAEAPIMFSKAAEIFISELSLRAWIHTEDNKRRTLQRNDIAMAITKYDQFDFLIDIVPRDEVKPAKREESSRQQTNVMAPEQVQYYFQLSQLQQNATSAPPQPQVGQLPSDAHIIQQNGQVIIAAQSHQLAALAGTGAQIVQIQPSAGQQPATTQAETEATQTQQILQQNVAQTQQVMTANGQQVQYIRLPPGALQQGSNIAQVVQLQNLQQQQQQQQANTTTVQSTTSSTASSETQPQEQPTYSQIYQPLQGLPPGAVYVMAQPPSSQGVTTTNQS